MFNQFKAKKVILRNKATFVIYETDQYFFDQTASSREPKKFKCSDAKIEIFELFYLCVIIVIYCMFRYEYSDKLI